MRFLALDSLGRSRIGQENGICYYVCYDFLSRRGQVIPHFHFINGKTVYCSVHHRNKEICARLSNLDVCYSVSSFNVAKAKIPNGYKTCSFLLISVWGLATRLNNGLLCLGIHSDCTIDCQILKHIALE
jgi:hypothetical protein